MTWTMFACIAWLLLSWWPHDNLHLHVGLNLQGLLFIEYGFHVTLMLAGGLLALCFVRLLRPPATSTQAKGVLTEQRIAEEQPSGLSSRG